jgi:hypothetical protein
VTDPELPEDAYPAHWKPAHVRAAEERETKRAENTEVYLGELDDAALDELITRIRPNLRYSR